MQPLAFLFSIPVSYYILVKEDFDEQKTKRDRSLSLFANSYPVNHWITENGCSANLELLIDNRINHVLTTNPRFNFYLKGFADKIVSDMVNSRLEVTLPVSLKCNRPTRVVHKVSDDDQL